MRHFLRIAHHDVEIEHVHLRLLRKAGPWLDQATVQCPHPVGKAICIVGQVSGGLLYRLQLTDVRIGRVEKIDRINGFSGGRSVGGWLYVLGNGGSVRWRLRGCT